MKCFFNQVSSILTVKYEVKLSAECEGVGIKDNEKNLTEWKGFIQDWGFAR